MINANAVNINTQHQDAHSDVKHTFACQKEAQGTLEMMQKLLEVLGWLQKLQWQLSVCRRDCSVLCREARFLCPALLLPTVCGRAQLSPHRRRLLSAHGIIGNVRESISHSFSDL